MSDFKNDDGDDNINDTNGSNGANCANDESDDDLEEISKSNKNKKINQTNKKNTETITQTTPMIAKIMNKYKINIDELETILKIEKLNQNNDVKKKKFTITLKKDIQKFLDDYI
jgi:hypothetical protein